MIITNTHLRIISVVLAICLWLYIVTGEFQEISLYVPVKLTNIPEGSVAVTDENLINVMAKGPKFLVNNKQFNKVQIAIDVSRITSGTKSVYINPEDVQMPAGIEVTNIHPKTIDVTVDTLVKKQMKVAPTFVGEPMPGYKVGSVVIKPDTVEINAATSKIKGLRSIETMPVNLSGKKDPITYSIGLKFYEGIQKTTPEFVEVFVMFKEDIQQKTFHEIEVSPLGLQRGLTANVLTDFSLTVSGRSDLLNEQTIANVLNPHIDLSDVDSGGVYKRTVVFNDSKILKVLDVKPAKVRVEVQ
ncbi:YbbR-like domain-containing protein [Seleniivibrio woodruffii]|uniref:CdaR family protein n=1 Tax=Seleniivibrio woodruffii TaxID=1078050 RepID=UPI0026F05741|nr:YbbR-like domain-containing protein [Seleniivibrio woodruffii]